MSYVDKDGMVDYTNGLYQIIDELTTDTVIAETYKRHQSVCSFMEFERVLIYTKIAPIPPQFWILHDVIDSVLWSEMAVGPSLEIARRRAWAADGLFIRLLKAKFAAKVASGVAIKAAAATTAATKANTDAKNAAAAAAAKSHPVLSNMRSIWGQLK